MYTPAPMQPTNTSLPATGGLSSLSQPSASAPSGGSLMSPGTIQGGSPIWQRPNGPPNGGQPGFGAGNPPPPPPQTGGQLPPAPGDGMAYPGGSAPGTGPLGTPSNPFPGGQPPPLGGPGPVPGPGMGGHDWQNHGFGGGQFGAGNWPSWQPGQRFQGWHPGQMGGRFGDRDHDGHGQGQDRGGWQAGPGRNNGGA